MGLFQKSRSAIVSPMNPGEVNQGATIRVEDEFGQEITPAPATPPRLPSPKPSPKKPKKSKKEKKKKKRKTSLNRTQYFPEVVESRKKKKATSPVEILLFSTYMRIIYVLALCLLVGFIIPGLLDLYVYDEVFANGKVPGTCHIVEGVRTDCMPDTTYFNETTCLARGCCYQELDLEIGAPLCHHTLPSVHSLNSTSLDIETPVDQNLAVFNDVDYDWPHNQFASPAIRVRQMAPGHVTVLFYDSQEDPGLNDGGSPEITDLKILLRNKTYVDDARVRMKISRPEAPETTLLDSSYGSLILGSTLSEISFLLPRTAIYGLGGHTASFGMNTTYTNRTLYNTDSRITGHLGHSFPMFLAMDDTRHYFGGYMEAQRPLTIEAYPGLGSSVKDSPLLVFRSMGGYLLFHIYTGPSPADVMGQLRSHLGPPRLPPLWSMGYHVCRRTGNPQDFGINYSNMTSAEIPYDSDCIDEGLLSSANQLSTSQDDPSQLFFQDALDYMSNEATSRIKLLIANPVQVAINAPDYGGGTYVKNEQGGIVIGNYNSENASIPDFPASSEWWSTGVSNLLNHPELVNNTVGMSLIHNSPYLVLRDGEECNMTSVTYIPYELRRSFGKGTLCPNHRHRDGTVDHLSAHNRYGKDVTEATINSLQGGGPGDRHKVNYVFTKHASPGVARFGGVFGSEFQASWDNLKMSLREVLELGMAGVPMVSMTACGIHSNVQLNTSIVVDELCLRWFQMAAFMPALNSLHGTEEQTRLPYMLAGTYREWIKRALEHRLRLIPYLYTQMYLSTETGLPMVRPIFFEFPGDHKAQLIYQQFMAGDSILVSPMLEINDPRLRAYFPYSTWYEIWSGQQFWGKGDWEFLDDIPYQITAHIRAGKIVPIMEESFLTIQETYAKSTYDLLVALGCDISPRTIKTSSGRSATQCRSQGQLYDPSLEEVIDLEATQITGRSGSLSVSSGVCGGLQPANNVSSVIIYGMATMPTLVHYPDGTDVPVTEGHYEDQVYYDSDTQRLQMRNVQLNWCDSSALEISWEWQ